MDKARIRVICFLRMCANIRKNELPEWVAGSVADKLFWRLDANPHLLQSKRIENILELLSRLGRNERDFPAFSQLGDALKRYQWRYGLELSSSGLSAGLRFAKEMSEEDEWEYDAVRFLVNLVPRRINRLRRCAYDGCKGWFFAVKRVDQQFCKRGACRQNSYDNNPAIREKKKRKMREIRATEKKRGETLKKQIGYRAKSR